MKLPKATWQEMKAIDFATGGVNEWIAVLPVAAVEQHGPHLPLGTDAMIAEGLIRAVIERLPEDLPITFLPLQQVGKSNEHVTFGGTLSLQWDTAARAWIEIGHCVARAGIRKLIIINAHGGNRSTIDVVGQELRGAGKHVGCPDKLDALWLPGGRF